MKTPILGSAYVARSVNAADNRMVNLYPEIVPEGGKEPAFLLRAPGLRAVTSVGNGPIRGMWQFAGYLFVVSGGELYKLDSTYSATLIGNIAGLGQVSMADNGYQLFISVNPQAYVYNHTTGILAQVTTTAFPGSGVVGFLDGYFVFNEPGTQRFWITALYDGLQIDALDFASAEGSPDNVVSLIVDHRELWLFGSNSVEVWYNSGGADFPFTRIQGAFNELGCAAAYSVAKIDNGIFWLGADARGKGIVYRADGYTGKRVSTHAIEWQIQQYPVISDAIGYTYQQDGHSFYVLTFPTASATWVFDISTGEWHERAAWQNDTFTRHRSNCQIAFNGEVLVGDYETGNIFAFDASVYTDNGQEQKWLRSWRALPTGENTLVRTTQHSLQLDCETGVGLNGYAFPAGGQTLATEADDTIIAAAGEAIAVGLDYVQGADPQVMLRWSDDGGHTWSNEHWKSMGKIGRFGYRTIWRRLGMTMKIRDRVYEVSGTDPVKLAIVGANLLLSPTNA